MSRYSGSADQRAAIKTFKHLRYSPQELATRTSRSNSSKQKTSSKKSSHKKSKRSRQRSNNSKHSSRRALGFESIDSNKSPKKFKKKKKNDYLLNKFQNLRKSDQQKPSEWNVEQKNVSHTKPPLPHTPNPNKFMMQ